jgi:hypothetical protein
MKKQLLIMSLLVLTAGNAQFTDDIESYALGPVHEGHWNSWDGSAGAIDAIVTGIRANSGTQSILIQEGGTQDAILDLGNKGSGVWTVNFKLYIPSDSTGYYNFQEIVPVSGGAFTIDLFFNRDALAPGNGEILNDAQEEVATFSYPQDAWFDVSHVINVTTDMVFITIDGNVVYEGPFSSGSKLGGIDFYSIDDNNRMYIDDIDYFEGSVGVEEIDSNLELSVYPNPVNDILNLTAGENITNVTIYDMLGKVVSNADFSALSLTVNTSNLASGSYMVKVTMGDKTKMVKVLK